MTDQPMHTVEPQFLSEIDRRLAEAREAAERAAREVEDAAQRIVRRDAKPDPDPEPSAEAPENAKPEEGEK